MTESIVLAAVRTGTGHYSTVERPGRHADVVDHLINSGVKLSLFVERGFITSEGRFVGRKEALRIAKGAGQVDKNTDITELHSENVW